MERRARIARGQAAQRRWEYRQRNLARGTWFELRRLLAYSARAHVISAEDAALLVSEGFLAQPVGARLEPPKVILVVPAERLDRLEHKSEIPVRLGRELLAARHLALVPFE